MVLSQVNEIAFGTFSSSVKNERGKERFETLLHLMRNACQSHYPRTDTMYSESKIVQLCYSYFPLRD